MYKICKTEQSAQRQRDLENGLMNAMLTRSYEDISIIDLCEQLQIPRKAFYRYFSSKDGAFHALLDHTLQECSLYLSETADTRQLLEEYFSFWLSKKTLLDAMAHSGLSGKLVERTLSEALRDPSFTSHLFHESSILYRKNAALFIVSGMMSVIIQWHHDGCVESPQEMAAIMSDLLTSPLF